MLKLPIIHSCANMTNDLLMNLIALPNILDKLDFSMDPVRGWFDSYKHMSNLARKITKFN